MKVDEEFFACWKNEVMPSHNWDDYASHLAIYILSTFSCSINLEGALLEECTEWSFERRKLGFSALAHFINLKQALPNA